MKKRTLLLYLVPLFITLFFLNLSCSNAEGTDGLTGGPKETDVKFLLERLFNHSIEGRKDAIEYQSIKIFPPRLSGELGHEGMPAGKRNTYYPVRVVFTLVNTYTSDGSVRRSDKDYIVALWRGLDNEWTLNIQERKKG